MGGKAATPDGISVASYYAMYAIDRLIAAGIKSETAFDIAYCFLQQDNAPGLERYIRELERGQRQRPND